MLQQRSRRPFEAFTLDGLYSAEELLAFREFVLSGLHGSQVSSQVSSQASSQVKRFAAQEFDNGRVVAPRLSQLMWTRLEPFLPPAYEDAEGRCWEPRGVTDKVFFARVEPGQEFGIHTDTGCEYDETRNRYSKFTLLTYLNDDFAGGGTTFYDHDEFKESFSVAPREGRTLVFDIDLFHAGQRVLSGGPKLWIGTEIVCARG